MTKKILIGLAPLLAVAAFAVMPAFAQAQTRAYGTCETGEPQEFPPCPEGEKKFTAFTTTVKVRDEKAIGSGNFILTDTVTGAKVECETFKSFGTDKNVGGVGMSEDTLIFDHCFTLFEGKKCKVNTAGAGAGVIAGVVTDEVLAGGVTVKIKIKSGFKLVFSGPPPVGCLPTGTVIGTVTGTATGAQAAGGNVLVFAAAPGLLLGTDASTITGSSETYTEGTDKPVVIN
jgi:hypothetical protein